MNSDSNPYESPQVDAISGEQQGESSSLAGARCFAPALALLVLGVVDLCIWLWISLNTAIEAIQIHPEGIVGQQMILWVPVIGVGGLLLAKAFTLFGALQMLLCRRLWPARMAATIALLPICSPLLVVGMPIGIWASIVLADREVRSHFADQLEKSSQKSL